MNATQDAFMEMVLDESEAAFERGYVWASC